MSSTSSAAATASSAINDPETWIYPPPEPLGQNGDLVSGVGPVFYGDSMIVQWTPASATPYVGAACNNATNGELEFAVVAANTSTSPVKYQFRTPSSATNLTGTIYCHLWFPGTKNGNSVTFIYSFDLRETASTFSASAQSSTTSQSSTSFSSASSTTSKSISVLSSSFSSNTIVGTNIPDPLSSDPPTGSPAPSNKNLSAGAGAGIGIGAFVVAAVIVAVAVIWWRRRRQSAYAPANTHNSGDVRYIGGPMLQRPELQAEHVSEADSKVPTAKSAQELP